MEQAGRARARQLRDKDELSYREIATALQAEDIQQARGALAPLMAAPTMTTPLECAAKWAGPMCQPCRSRAGLWPGP